LKKRMNGFSKPTISPRSSFSNEKSDKTDAVPRINGTNTSWKIAWSRYLFAYGQACFIIRLTHSARSISGKNTYNKKKQ